MLADNIFDYCYSATDNRQPEDFFLQAFRNSLNLDLGLGFFSSASFNILADGLATFIVNGGRMNMYINKYVTKEDWNLLKGNVDDNDFDQDLIESYLKLKETLSKRDEHFFKCLSYLIRQERLGVRIVVLDNGGLPHEKYGIFTDEKNNKIYFNGSLNMTAQALVGNLETIECTCSWQGEDSLKRVNNFEDHFHKIWNGNADGVKIYEAKKFCNEILRDYPNVDSHEIIEEEEKFIVSYRLKVSNKPCNAPHFPNKYGKPFEYQEEAYDNWVKNGKMGIFAMATGTGKTVTSLNCALKEFGIDGFYRLLILVPTLDLVEQWLNELKNFNFKKVIAVSSKNPQWKREFMEVAQKVRRDKPISFVVISTYDSFVLKDFQLILPVVSQNMMLIADEVHNVGSKRVKTCFDRMTIPKRIGLSATPERIYDDDGTEVINSYFKDHRPYTYSFPMSRAIKEGRLCKYFYYPKVAYLNGLEYDKYKYFTKKLAELWNPSEKNFKNKELAEEILMNRKRIIHKCHDKLRVYENIIREIGEEHLKYAFVYAPEGNYNFGDAEQERLSEEDDVRFMQKLIDITKRTFPSITCSSFSAAKSSKERKSLLKSFGDGIINVLLAMKCLDEGVDIPRAQYGIFTSSTGNPRQFIQRRGRLLRTHPDKKYSYIYDIIVLPTTLSESNNILSMEQSIVKSELTRAAYFASLSENHLTDAYEVLTKIAKHYHIIWPEIINEINDKQ